MKTIMNTHSILANLGFAFALSLGLSACDFSCSGKTTENAAANTSANTPTFDENYAYGVIKKYESFGPKVPGTPEHKKAGDWMVQELKTFSSTVFEQTGSAKTFEGNTVPLRNIIVQFNPSAKVRYLLSAHWDNRPFADEDKVDKKGPIPGVNDGGSGVAVLMTIAKALKDQKMSFGVDLAFFDLEDWGTPRIEESYCLGTQYWAKNPVPANYTAKFGVNYDMVGRIGSQFPVEVYSYEKGAEVYDKLHAAAQTLGYQDFFPSYKIGPVVDDHVYVMQGRGFPMIDLIYMTEQGRFPPEWHTHDDTSEYISRDVLKVVGQTTLQMLFADQSK
jgi:glutaminyl-peptide cyclotransferase